MFGVMEWIRVIAVLMLIIFLANYSLSYLNRFMTKRNTQMKIIEKLVIGKNSTLSIIQVCSKYYLVSSNENKSEIIKELAAEEAAAIQLEQKLVQEAREIPRALAVKNKTSFIFQRIVRKAEKRKKN